MAGISFGNPNSPARIRAAKEKQARLAAERAAFVAKAKIRSDKQKAQRKSQAEGFAKAVAAQRLRVSAQSPALRKAAGITPTVERLAAEGSPAAITFLKAAEARVRGASKLIARQAQPVFRIIKTKFGQAITTDKFGRKSFQVGLAFASGGSAAVQAFQRQFAKETAALGRAKGAAKGASIKAGKTSEQIASGAGLGGNVSSPINIFRPAPGKTFKVSLQDGIGISESGSATKFTPTTQPKAPPGSQRVAGVITGGTVKTSQVGILNLSPFPFVSVQSKTVISQSGITGGFIGPVKPQQKGRNILEIGQDRLQAVSASPLKFILGTSGLINLGVTKTALSTFAFLTNVEKQLGGLITGKRVGGLTEVSKEPTSEFLGASITAGFEGKNPLEAGGKAFLKEAKRFGALETVGNVGVFLIPGTQGLKSLSPLKIISFEGSKLLVGSLPKKSVVFFSKAPGGKVVKGFDITSIGKEKFAALTTKFSVKAKGGAEIDFLGKTQGKILTSEKSLKSLTSAGFITKGGADLIRAGKTVIKESKGLPKPVFRETFPQGSFGLSPKQLQAQTKFFKESKITLEGSSIDAFANIPRFSVRPGDADIKVKSIIEGQKLAAENLKKLQPFATKGQSFAIGGKDKTQVLLFQRGKSSKVTEFLTPSDETGQLAKKGFVLGVKTDTSTFKTAQGVKIRSGRFQTARMIASITSLQPGKGAVVRIGPPINPLGSGTTRAKDFPKAFARAKTEASIAATELLKGKAQKLEGAASIIKREGSKEISFSKFFKERAVKPERLPLGKTTVKGFKEPSVVSKISGSQSLTRSLSQSQRLTSPIRSLVSKSPRSPLTSRSPASIRSPSIKSSFSKSVLGSLGSVGPFSPQGPSLSKLTGKPGSPTPGKPGAPGVPSKGGPISKFSETSSTSAVLQQARKLTAVNVLIGGQLARTKPSPRRRRVDFFGNVFESEIRSFRTVKKDIDFGRNLTSRIAQRETVLSKRGSLIGKEITGKVKKRDKRKPARLVRSSKLKALINI